MSAAEGVVRTDTLGPDPTRETRFTATPPSSAVSPELALIDADLARELRAQLTEPAPPSRPPVVETVPAQEAASVGTLRQELEPEPRQPTRESGRRSRKLRVLGFVALGALLTVFVRNEPRPSALDRIAGVAADPNAQAQTPEQRVPAGTAAAGSTPAGQTFVWAAEPGAAAYEFQLFRGDARIYRARVTAPRLDLPGRWRQGGRTDSPDRGDLSVVRLADLGADGQPGIRRNRPGHGSWSRGRAGETRRTPRDLPRSRDRGPRRRPFDKRATWHRLTLHNFNHGVRPPSGLPPCGS